MKEIDNLKKNKFIKPIIIIALIIIGVGTVCANLNSIIDFWQKLNHPKLPTSIGDQNKSDISLQRPYLIPKLLSNPPCFTIDGQSVMTFTLMDKQFIYARFRLYNNSSISALNVRGKYDSPTQENERIEMAENVILPKSFSQRYWTPWVNIQSVVNEQNNNPFDVTLTIEYDGENGVDSQKYLSFLKLKIKKISNDKYRLIDEKVTFGVKEK